MNRNFLKRETFSSSRSCIDKVPILHLKQDSVPSTDVRHVLKVLPKSHAKLPLGCAEPTFMTVPTAQSPRARGTLRCRHIELQTTSTQLDSSNGRESSEETLPEKPVSLGPGTCLSVHPSA